MLQKPTAATLEGYQQEMRDNYLSGAIGVLVSGSVWLVSAFTLYSYPAKQAIWTLLVGGMLIHPISVVITKILGASGSHSKENKLGGLGLEGTIFMIMTIPLAYGLSLLHTEWFFCGMLLIIGGRYLTFHTLYGNKIFWIFGGTLGLAAYLLFSINAQAFTTVLTGGLLEILFGIFIFMLHQKKKTKAPLSSQL